MWMFAVLGVAHIAGAMAGMGPFVILPLFARQIAAKPESLPHLLPLLGAVAKFPKIGGIVQLITGVLMVGLRGWHLLLTPWIAASLVLTVIAILVGAKGLGPAAGKLVGILKSGRIEAGAVGQATAQMSFALKINGVLLTLITLLMVIRPSF